MEKKKILMVCEAFGGGVFTYVSQLCNDMVDDFEVYLAYSLRPQTPKNYKEFLNQKVHLIEMKHVGVNGVINLRSDIAAIKELRQIEKNVKPDVIHLHSSVAGGLGRIAYSGKNNIVVYTPHGYAKEGILFLSGDAYIFAVIPMQVIMPTILFIGLTNIMGIQMLVPLGREKVVLYSEIAGAIVDLILNAMLIPQLASAGAAIGTLVAEGVVWIVQFIALRKEVIPAYRNVRYGAVILATFVGVVSSSWVKMLGMGNFVTLIFLAVLFFGGYGVILTVLKEPLVWEIESQVLKKLTKKK